MKRSRRLSQFKSVRVAHMRISAEQRFRFKRRTFHVPNLTHKLSSFIFTDKQIHRENESTRGTFLSSGWTQIAINLGTYNVRRLNFNSTDYWKLKKLNEIYLEVGV